MYSSLVYNDHYGSHDVCVWFHFNTLTINQLSIKQRHCCCYYYIINKYRSSDGPIGFRSLENVAKIMETLRVHLFFFFFLQYLCYSIVFAAEIKSHHHHSHQKQEDSTPKSYSHHNYCICRRIAGVCRRGGSKELKKWNSKFMQATWLSWWI